MGCPEGTPDSSVPELARTQKAVDVAGGAGRARARAGTRRARGLAAEAVAESSTPPGRGGRGPAGAGESKGPWETPSQRAGVEAKTSLRGETGTTESWLPKQAVLTLRFPDGMREPGFSIFKGHETEDKVNLSHALRSILATRGNFSLPAVESLVDLPCRPQLAVHADRSEPAPTCPVQGDLEWG